MVCYPNQFNIFLFKTVRYSYDFQHFSTVRLFKSAVSRNVVVKKILTEPGDKSAVFLLVAQYQKKWMVFLVNATETLGKFLSLNFLNSFTLAVEIFHSLFSFFPPPFLFFIVPIPHFFLYISFLLLSPFPSMPHGLFSHYFNFHLFLS